MKSCMLGMNCIFRSVQRLAVRKFFALAPCLPALLVRVPNKNCAVTRTAFRESSINNLHRDSRESKTTQNRSSMLRSCCKYHWHRVMTWMFKSTFQYNYNITLKHKAMILENHSRNNVRTTLAMQVYICASFCTILFCTCFHNSSRFCTFTILFPVCNWHFFSNCDILGKQHQLLDSSWGRGLHQCWGLDHFLAVVPEVGCLLPWPLDTHCFWV